MHYLIWIYIYKLWTNVHSMHYLIWIYIYKLWTNVHILDGVYEQYILVVWTYLYPFVKQSFGTIHGNSISGVNIDIKWMNIYWIIIDPFMQCIINHRHKFVELIFLDYIFTECNFNPRPQGKKKKFTECKFSKKWKGQSVLLIKGLREKEWKYVWKKSLFSFCSSFHTAGMHWLHQNMDHTSRYTCTCTYIHKH